METLTLVNRPSTHQLLEFIAAYRSIEKSGKVRADRKLISIVADSLADSTSEFLRHRKHLMDQWISKEKGFGQFFLNLSWKSSIHLLVNWQILDNNDVHVRDFLSKVEQDRYYQFLNRPTGKVLQFRNMILLFENHGMNPQVCEGIHLTVLPTRKEDRFGNSANWGKYILSLERPLQDKFFDDLFTHYHG